MMNENADILILGTDEAGYGPNLGPLLLGCSCWQIALEPTTAEACEPFLPKAPTAEPEEKKPVKKSKKKKAEPIGPTLFAMEDAGEEPDAQDAASDPVGAGLEIERGLLERAVERLNAGLAPISDRKGLFPLVDSKKLYTSGSLAALERSFFLALASLEHEPFCPTNFREVLTRVAREGESACVPPWEEELALTIPRDPKTGSADALAERLDRIRAVFAEGKTRLLDLGARRVQPSEFNALVDRLGLKSDLIADVTLSTVVETFERVLARSESSSAPRLCVALCDKLGGRDRYLPILAKRFPGAELRAVVETRAASVYRLIAETGLARDGRVVRFASPIALEIRFTAKGESNAPTALASICAKYLRELSIDAFNAYWRRESGDALRPTAGYPVDAVRFRADVEERRRALGIDDEVFWRKK